MFGLRKRKVRPGAQVPAGQRFYAIGDVHGRLDLLQALLATIEGEVAGMAPARTFLVLLGDLVDRGPDSRGVLELLSTTRFGWATPIYLHGNHEELFLRVLDGEDEVVHDWLEFGGTECAESYGLPPTRLATMTAATIVRELNRLVPEAHRSFLGGFYDSFAIGDYLFAHAGIRPGIALEEQEPRDLRWIRAGFLDDRSDHGVTVVHGHTIVDEATDYGNRIAVDTGAYRSGLLTALFAEGGERRFVSARADR